jgi:RNA recognition motif-containing protein
VPFPESLKAAEIRDQPSPYVALADMNDSFPGAPPSTTPSTGVFHESCAVIPEVGPETNVVRLRGLPFTATVQDIFVFFAQCEIVDRIASDSNAVDLLLRSNGRPSGQARVRMQTRSDAELAQRLLHGQWMGKRYIEVFLNEESLSDTAAQGKHGSCDVSRTPSKGGAAAVLQPQALPTSCTTQPQPLLLQQELPFFFQQGQQHQQHRQAFAEVAAAFQALSAPPSLQPS